MKKLLLLSGALVFLLLGSPAYAALSGGGPEPLPSDIVRLVESEQYDRAIPQLQSFLKKNRKNADAWNWLGYSQRSSGDLDGALKSYKKALKLDRKHLGANEYLGELYIMLGDMDSAEKQLELLGKFCDNCEEFQKLDEVIRNSQ